VLVVDTDPQFALTRQLGLEVRAVGVNLVDVLAGRAAAADAIVAGVHGLDVIPAARELAGVEMSLVGELGRERFLRDALELMEDAYAHVVIDTPPNLGLLTVNALVCADRVIAPVSAEDEASLHVEATAARLQDTIATAIGTDVSARPYRDGYQVVLDHAAGDRLTQLLAATSTSERAPVPRGTP
jgi:chromosome partitioning protein